VVAGVWPYTARGLSEHPYLFHRWVLCLADVVLAPVTSSATPPNKICAASLLSLPPLISLQLVVVARGVEISGGLELFAAGRVPNGALAQHQRTFRAGLRRAPLLGVVDLPAPGGGWAPSNKCHVICRSRPRVPSSLAALPLLAGRGGGGKEWCGITVVCFSFPVGRGGGREARVWQRHFWLLWADVVPRTAESLLFSFL
jgi:hypothetical protein